MPPCATAYPEDVKTLTRQQIEKRKAQAVRFTRDVRDDPDRARQWVPPGPRRCALCGSTRFLVVDHIEGDEWNDAPENLRWLCKSCNTRRGIAMARAGKGRKTRQYNPGADNLAQYVQAA